MARGDAKEREFDSEILRLFYFRKVGVKITINGAEIFNWQ